MIKVLIKKYKWCKFFGVKHPLKATLDKNFMKGLFQMPKQMVKHIHCPVNGWDCPYYTDENHPCRCTLADPMKDCDDFATFWDEGDDYIDDDWVIGE